MAIDETIHHRFIQRGNALVEEFEGAATMTAAAFGKAVESRLVGLLKAIDKVEGNPYESPLVRDALAGFFKEVEALGLEFFGPNSLFEAQTVRVMGSMARNGMDRLLAEFRAQRFVLKQTLLDATAIKAAATDAYALAAKNLATVDPLRQLMTAELIQGNGPMSLAQSLASAGYLVDGKQLPLIEPLVRGGRTYTVEQRAAMMARTEPRRLQEMTYQSGAAKVEPDPNKRLFRWVSVLAPTSTQDSLDRHGHMMTKAEWETTPWPNDRYTGLPPLRPNDRCSVIFYRESWLSAENRDALKKTAPTSEGRRVLAPGQKEQLDALKAKPAAPGSSAPAPKPAAAPAVPAAAPAALLPPGPPSFATATEAEAWIVESGAVKAAKLGGIYGMSASAANRVVAVVDSFIRGLKLPKLRGIVAQPGMKGAHGRYGGGVIELGTSRFDAAAANLKGNAEAAKVAARAVQLQEQLPAWESKLAERKAELATATGGKKEFLKVDVRALEKTVESARLGIKISRWSMSTSEAALGDAVENTTLHEYGHHLHAMMDLPDQAMKAAFGQDFKGTDYGYTRLGGKYAKGQLPTFKNLYKPNAPNMTGVGAHNAAALSEYATTNHAECFAEAFVAYVRGRKDLLAPGVLEVVEEVVQRARQLGKLEWGE